MTRPGTVLVLALLAVLAMELIALSVFGFARIAHLGAINVEQHAQLQVTADDALAAGAASIDALDVAARTVGSSWSLTTPATSLPNGDVVTTAQRAADQLVVLTARAAVADGAGVTSRGLLRILSPGAILDGFPAVITTALPPGPSTPPGTADASACGLPLEAVPAALPPWVMRAWADSLLFGAAAAVAWSDTQALATTASASSPDSARLLVVTADSTIAGTFRGAIAASGNLRLAAGADVRGLLAVRGVLTLEPGAAFGGAARALALEHLGGVLVYDRCAIAGALRTHALRRAYRAGPRWRVPAF